MADDDPLVVFTPSGKRGRFPKGTAILAAARKLGVDLDSVCGGRGICSRCQINPAFGSFPKHGIEALQSNISSWNAIEERYRSKRGLREGRRLGCQAKLLGDAVVDVPPESQVHKQVVRKYAADRKVEMAPATRLLYIEVDEPDMHDPSGDFERVRKALANQWEVFNAVIDFGLLKSLQSALRNGRWSATVAMHEASSGEYPRIVAIWPGFYDGAIYGVAIDLGSTTIAAHLCDLRDGSVLASAGRMNPQIRFGEDLMSRVSYSMMNPSGASQMTEAVAEAVDDVISDVACEADVDFSAILELVVVCNPVMHHLFLGIDPVELGQAPFALAVADAVCATATDLRLRNPPAAARAYLLPCIAGHVGADAAAVVLSEEPHKTADRVLVVDVGTNAEVIFADRNGVLACSSPTGPAFEGAQISSGQRAAPGAIERVEIDPSTKEPRYKVIGCDLWSDEKGFNAATSGTGITGICGSGIIEAVAEMRMCGILDKSGLIGSSSQTGSSRCRADGRTNLYVIRDAERQGENPIAVTQADVRAIQLAKSALYAGAKLLMEEAGASSVDRIVLAGAFGAHISPKHAMVLGMIPDCRLDNVVSAGNAAGTGARIALCNVDSRREIEKVVRSIKKVETAVEPKFQEHFVNANALPHAKDAFPNLANVLALSEQSFNLMGAVRGGDARRRRKRK
ncbi:MAG: ASKHA domain-containing protein [Albidovulum sp.]|nr:ASKHA domain-containing protein [Albidovulum sp.]